MRIPFRVSPHIYSVVNNRTIMTDVILVLLALYGLAYFTYGPRALILACVSVVTCAFWDQAGIILKKKKMTPPDLSSVVTGMLIPLMLPASISYTIIICAATFATAVVKLPFGGVGNNIFNPAASGVAFTMVCWGSQALSYPTPYQTLSVFGSVDVPLYSSVTYTLWVGGVPSVTASDIWLGAVSGPMGTTNVLVLITCALYLIAKRCILVTQPLCTLAVMSIIAFVLPRGALQGWTSVWMELAAMPTLFYITFIACEPVTTPTRRVVKAVYAGVLGLFIMIFRHHGGIEVVAPFVIIFMNALTPLFEMCGEHVARLIRSENMAADKNYKQAVFDQVEESDE